MAHNMVLKAEKEFEKHVDFNAEQFLVDLYFHFDYSSKRKNQLVEFCDISEQEYQKILKFVSIHWLGLSHSIERALKMYPSTNLIFAFFNHKLENRLE